MPSGIPVSQPADPYAWAVQQANREYPRLAQYNMQLTYDPKLQAQFGSETYPPTGEDARYPGHWTVAMGPKVYQNKQAWPGLVALEGLHPLQAEDPKYQGMVAQLQKMLTPEQLTQLRGIYTKSLPDEHRSFEQWLPQVQMQELIRDRLFAPYWHKYEGAPVGGWNEYNLNPEQQKLIDQIDAYMRMK